MNDERERFYEGIAADFDSLINPYDLKRRLEIVFDELLPDDLTDGRVLDLGSGTGWFSQRASGKRADVVSLDISRSLIRITYERAQDQALVADAGRTPFPRESFQVIISSEVLEHMRDPSRGIAEIGRILAPGGIAAITTPNRRWLWLVRLATGIGMRPYRGYENFLGYDELRQLLVRAGLELEVHQGFHPWPFHLSFLQPISRWVDRNAGRGLWGMWMVNQAVRVRKVANLIEDSRSSPVRISQGSDELA